MLSLVAGVKAGPGFVPSPLQAAKRSPSTSIEPDSFLKNDPFFIIKLLISAEAALSAPLPASRRYGQLSSFLYSNRNAAFSLYQPEPPVNIPCRVHVFMIHVILTIIYGQNVDCQ
jgi:hypothetical protein